jgi:lysophospholipase L1-like esterase
LTTLLAIGISLACAEVLFRWYSGWKFDDEFPPWTENLVALRSPQIFEFKPNASGVFPGSVDVNRTFPYRTNGVGLRDRDRGAKQPGEKRVLVIGDSYTWGYAVAEEEAYPQVALAMLKARGIPDVDVINGGVPDYNSRQERQLLERLLPVYKPDAVFLGYVVNDAEPSTAMPVPPEETYRHARSWFLTELAEVLNRRLFHRRLLPSAKDTPGQTYLDGFAESSVKWKDSKEALREMRDLSAAAGVSFTVLVLPDFTQWFDERYTWKPIHDAVSTWGRDLGIPTFDLLTAFKGLNNASMMVPWDGHPNAEGHRRMAEFLVARILDEPRLRSGTALAQ